MRDLTWEELIAESARLGRDARFVELTDDEVLEALSVGAAQIDAAVCRWLELLAEFVVRGVWADEGARTPGAWLSWRLGVAPSTAREHVRVALRLREFPAVRERFAAGTLSYSKVRALTRFGDPAMEQLLLDWADDATAAQMEAVARGFRTAERAKLDAAMDGEPETAWSFRGRWFADGTRSLTIRGPAEVVAAIEEQVDRLAAATVADRAATHPLEVDAPRTAAAPPATPDADVGSGLDPASGPDVGSDQDAGSDPDAPAATGTVTGGVGRSDGDAAGRADDLEGEPSSPMISAIDRVEALASAVAVVAAAEPPDTSGLDRHTLVLHASVDDVAWSLADPPPPHVPTGPDGDDEAIGSSSPAEVDGPDGSSAPAEADGPDGVDGLDGAGGPDGADRTDGGDDLAAGTGVTVEPCVASAEGRTAGRSGVEVVGVSDASNRIRGMDRGALRRLACDAGIVLLTTDRGGSPVDVGRRQRRTSAGLRRALHRRDRACSFPGCGAARNLHAHHVQHWADGGPTDLANLVLLCGFHHRFVHEQRWHIEVRRDGRHLYRRSETDRPVERVGRPPGASAESVTRAAPPTASAEALLPPSHRGGPFDLDLVVAVLQQEHERARSPIVVAA